MPRKTVSPNEDQTALLRDMQRRIELLERRSTPVPAESTYADASVPISALERLEAASFYCPGGQTFGSGAVGDITMGLNESSSDLVTWDGTDGTFLTDGWFSLWFKCACTATDAGVATKSAGIVIDSLVYDAPVVDQSAISLTSLPHIFIASGTAFSFRFVNAGATTKTISTETFASFALIRKT